MRYDVTVADVPARRVLARQLEVTIDGIGPAIHGAMTDVYACVARSGAEPAGEPFVIYHERPSEEAGWRIEVCAPVSDVIPAPAGYTFQEIPAGSVATTTHVGPYGEIAAAYTEIDGFIRAHGGLDFAGPPREIYLSEPDVPPRETRTRIEFPVSRVPVAIGAGASHP